ncbi:MAG TPA: hypothetical protein VHP58_06890 [Alphaproteobacteria bacterium]|nr:hypothetical protein [Alphaproteobacteria bacterium]
MKAFYISFRSFVALLVAALVANFYGGLGYQYDLHPYVYYGTAIAVLAIPVFWCSMHLCGGVLIGVAAGGLIDGLKLGMLLGIGMGLSKLWPYVLAAAAGCYIGKGPMVYVVGGVVVGILLFGIDRALMYFWKSTERGHSGFGAK